MKFPFYAVFFIGVIRIALLGVLDLMKFKVNLFRLC